MKHYNVVAAIIVNQNKILCMQRNKSKFTYTSYKYEFPGGKIEAGESAAEALARELREEMDMNINIREEDYFMTIEHTYPDFSITMQAFLCFVEEPKFVMKEHVASKWSLPQEMENLDWAAADLPIVEKIKQRFQKQ